METVQHFAESNEHLTLQASEDALIFNRLSAVLFRAYHGLNK